MVLRQVKKDLDAAERRFLLNLLSYPPKAREGEGG